MLELEEIKTIIDDYWREKSIIESEYDNQEKNMTEKYKCTRNKRIVLIFLSICFILLTIPLLNQFRLSTTVYLSRTGGCYHTSSCYTISSGIPIKLKDAKLMQRVACSICNPDGWFIVVSLCMIFFSIIVTGILFFLEIIYLKKSSGQSLNIQNEKNKEMQTLKSCYTEKINLTDEFILKILEFPEGTHLVNDIPERDDLYFSVFLRGEFANTYHTKDCRYIKNRYHIKKNIFSLNRNQKKCSICGWKIPHFNIELHKTMIKFRKEFH